MPGTPLDLTLHFYPTYGIGKTLRVGAQVVHSAKRSDPRHTHTGCRFDLIDEKAKRELAQFIDWLKDRNKNHYYAGVEED